MRRRFAALGVLVLIAACSEQHSEAPDPAAAGMGATADVRAHWVVLGSGTTSGTARDASNTLIVCEGPACPAGGAPQQAFLVPQHYAYGPPLPETGYIAPVADGTTLASPGYRCCTTATFENVFTLPSNAVSAEIIVSVLADNQALVAINGRRFGAQPPIVMSNFGQPSVFRVSFTPDRSGVNRLRVTLVDGGGALGLDYRATITYDVAPGGRGGTSR